MNILLTKNLSQEILDLIKSWGWEYEVVEVLKITPVEVNEVPSNAEAWIISSKNSFEGIKKFIANAPQLIYCVGDWRKLEIEKLKAGVQVKSFENMKSLAANLSEQNLKNVVYFCGEEHRQELEEGLKNTNTKISKVITHKSEMTFPVIDTAFGAVFVFSPRSAESLLLKNQFSPKTVFACIGSTTADYLRGRGVTNVFVSSYPDSKLLIEEFHNATIRSLKNNF